MTSAQFPLPRRRHFVLATLAAVAILVAGFGLSSAQPQPSNRIYACVKLNGVPRIVSSTSQYRTGESPLEWERLSRPGFDNHIVVDGYADISIGDPGKADIVISCPLDYSILGGGELDSGVSVTAQEWVLSANGPLFAGQDGRDADGWHTRFVTNDDQESAGILTFGAHAICAETT